VHGGVPFAGSFIEQPGRGWVGSPAAGVGDHGLLDGLAEVRPEMPAVTDLHRLRCTVADGFGIGG
jgi:hypothetical protein